MSEGYGSRWDAKQERKDSAQSTKNEVPQWMHEAAKEIGGMLSRRNEFHLMGVDVKEASRIIASHAPQLPADRESDSPTQILPRGEQTSYNCQPEVAAPPSKPDAEGKWPRYFEPVNDRGIHQRIVFDSEIAVGRWADGTTDVAINAGFAEYLKGDESYIETDAAGNALPQHEQANARIIESNMAADSESFAVDESRKELLIACEEAAKQTARANHFEQRADLAEAELEKVRCDNDDIVASLKKFTADDCLKLLDNCWNIILFKNGLGSYSAVAIKKAIPLKVVDSGVITDRFSPSAALHALTEKVFGNI